MQLQMHAQTCTIISSFLHKVMSESEPQGADPTWVCLWTSVCSMKLCVALCVTRVDVGQLTCLLATLSSSLFSSTGTPPQACPCC